MKSHGRYLLAVFVLVSLPLCLSSSSAAASATLLIADAYWPSWSPAGDVIACTRSNSGIGEKQMQIWTVPLAGGLPQMRTQDPNDAYVPLWVPGGESLVYCHMRDGEDVTIYEFIVLDLASGSGSTLEVPDFWDDAGMCLSPDGSEVLYTGGYHMAETWAVNLATGATRFVWAGRGGVISPDGEWIAYFTSEDSLRVSPITGGAIVRLGYGSFAHWTPDSRFIVFTNFAPSGNPDLMVVSRDGSYRQQLTDDADIEWWNEVSPSGDRLVFAKSAGEFEPSSVWILNLELPTAVEILTWGQIKRRFR